MKTPTKTTSTAEQVIDFVGQRRDLYAPGAEPILVDIPSMQFLMIDGAGMPDATLDNEFQQAMESLYGIVYSLKMSPKKGEAPEGYVNFRVSPPEGLWWVKGGSDFATARPEDWRWTLMIRVPEWVTKDAVEYFAAQLEQKKQRDSYRQVRLERFREGPSVQLMHVGSYDSEGADIDKIRAYITAHGYWAQGKHHEIYFGDPRRTPPEKLRTILRQPVSL